MSKMQTLLPSAQLSPSLLFLLQQVKIIRMVKYKTSLISYIKSTTINIRIKRNLILISALLIMSKLNIYEANVLALKTE